MDLCGACLYPSATDTPALVPHEPSAQHGRRRFRPHDARTRGGERDTACAALTESVHSLCRACGQLLCVPVPRVRAATGAQQRPVPPGLRTAQTGGPVFPAGRCACALCIQVTCMQVICIRPLVCRRLHPAACCRLSVIVGLLPARLAAAAESMPAARFGLCPQPGGFCRTAPDMLAGVQFCLQPGSLAGRAPERLPEAQPGSIEPVQCKNAWGFKPYGLPLRASTAVFSFHSGRAAWCCRRACCRCQRQTAFLCCCGMLSGRRGQGVQQGVQPREREPGTRRQPTGFQAAVTGNGVRVDVVFSAAGALSGGWFRLAWRMLRNRLYRGCRTTGGGVCAARPCGAGLPGSTQGTAFCSGFAAAA